MKTTSFVLSFIAIAVSAITLFLNASSPSLGAVNGDNTSFQNLVLQTYSGATSTLAVGCIQALATSSATTIKLIPQATSTQGTGNSGVVSWAYGTCP